MRFFPTLSLVALTCLTLATGCSSSTSSSTTATKEAGAPPTQAQIVKATGELAVVTYSLMDQARKQKGRSGRGRKTTLSVSQNVLCATSGTASLTESVTVNDDGSVEATGNAKYTNCLDVDDFLVDGSITTKIVLSTVGGVTTLTETLDGTVDEILYNSDGSVQSSAVVSYQPVMVTLVFDSSDDHETISVTGTISVDGQTYSAVSAESLDLTLPDPGLFGFDGSVDGGAPDSTVRAGDAGDAGAYNASGTLSGDVTGTTNGDSIHIELLTTSSGSAAVLNMASTGGATGSSGATDEVVVSAPAGVTTSLLTVNLGLPSYPNVEGKTFTEATPIICGEINFVIGTASGETAYTASAGTDCNSGGAVPKGGSFSLNVTSAPVLFSAAIGSQPAFYNVHGTLTANLVTLADADASAVTLDLTF
jgi:hypothetical protein